MKSAVRVGALTMLAFIGGTLLIALSSRPVFVIPAWWLAAHYFLKIALPRDKKERSAPLAVHVAELAWSIDLALNAPTKDIGSAVIAALLATSILLLFLTKRRIALIVLSGLQFSYLAIGIKNIGNIKSFLKALPMDADVAPLLVVLAFVTISRIAAIVLLARLWLDDVRTNRTGQIAELFE